MVGSIEISNVGKRTERIVVFPPLSITTKIDVSDHPKRHSSPACRVLWMASVFQGFLVILFILVFMFFIFVVAVPFLVGVIE